MMGFMEIIFKSLPAKAGAIKTILYLIEYTKLKHSSNHVYSYKIIIICFLMGALEIYLKEINRYPLLSEDDERMIDEGIINGNDKYREMLVVSNLRFVVHIARKYQDRGQLLLDLIQDGSLGLMKAAETYDPLKGYKFLTHSVFGIKGYILEGIYEKSKIIRLPKDTSVIADKVSSMKADGHSIEEISYITGKNKKSIEYLIYISTRHLPFDKRQRDEGLAPSGLVQDSRYFAEKDSDLREINRLLHKKLSPREADILIKTYGTNSNVGKYSLEELGMIYGITYQRASQIKVKTLKRLRKMEEFQELDSLR